MKLINRIAATATLLTACLGLRAEGGSSSYDFVNIPTSAHVMALGGCNTALIDDDVTLVDQNPALLGPEIERQAAFGYMHWLAGGNFASARYGMAAGDRAAWSAGMRYLNYGSIDGYDENGVATGSFTPSDLVIGGSYSHDFTDRWRGGISLDMLYSHYEQYSAFALSSTIGMNYYNPENDLSFSIVLANMGGQLKRFHDAYNRLPFDLRLGYMQTLGTSHFSIAVNARYLTKWNLKSYSHSDDADNGQLKSNFISNLFKHLVLGVQYAPSESFYIALGYDYKMRADMGTYSRSFLSGFTAGLGVRVRGWGFGAAFCQPHKGGTSLSLNISTSI